MGQLYSCLFVHNVVGSVLNKAAKLLPYISVVLHDHVLPFLFQTRYVIPWKCSSILPCADVCHPCLRLSRQCWHMLAYGASSWTAHLAIINKNKSTKRCSNIHKQSNVAITEQLLDNGIHVGLSQTSVRFRFRTHD